MSKWTTADMPSLEDAVIVVTGANSGLGFEATRAFVEKGATVVMACRSIDRGENAAETIRDQVETGGTLHVSQCDLADLSSVRAFADRVQDRYDHVDILCNNAGVMAIPRQETTDGFEMQLGVNHLGHFALTGLLFDAIAAAPGESRIVTHSSGMHARGEMDFEDLHWETEYSKWGAYGRSKLANLLFAYELQRRIDASDVAGVTSVACHPGYADTNLQHRMAEENGSFLQKISMRIANRVFAQSARRGSLPMLYAATADDVDGGDYIGPGGLMNMRGYPERQHSSSASYDEHDARQLWAYSTEATGVEFPLETPPGSIDAESA